MHVDTRNTALPLLAQLAESPRAYALSSLSAKFKQSHEDFQVTELLGFDCSGDGEHLWLQVRKSGVNTLDVIRRLSQITGVKQRDISYSGLKDKQGVCTQWFSVHNRRLTSENVQALNNEHIQVLQAIRNNRKLRRGIHAANHFVVRLHEVQAEPGISLNDWLSDRLALIDRQGVPNYFGEQRFGHQNIAQSFLLFSGAPLRLTSYQRGLILSAARSALFNLVLAERLRQNTWSTGLSGDVMNLDGTGSVFAAQKTDDALIERLQTMDIHPTGPLWGGGELMSREDCRLLEQRICGSWPMLQSGLEQAGLLQQRRSLRLRVKQLNYRVVSPASFELSFTLPSGCFATTVLREIVNYQTTTAADLTD